MSSITMSQKDSRAKNPEQNQEQLLPDLPSEIIINILSKLSVRTVATCKCVCKLWLNLIKSPEFVKSHLSESKPGLVVVNLQEDNSETVFRITEFEDSLDIDTIDPIIKLDFRDFIPNGYIWVQCVANGFLFVMVMESLWLHAYYICNPVTREYIELPNPIPEKSVRYNSDVFAYGFGISKWTGQYKLIRIFHDTIRNGTCGLPRISKFFCHVYTLGTGSWRSIKPVATLQYPKYGSGTFLNGMLHWLVMDSKGCIWVSCFDLETEVFSTFSPPPDLLGGLDFGRLNLVASGDYLYLCDDRQESNENETVVWLMKEYGVGKSWTKTFVFNKTTDLDDFLCEKVCPIKVYGHGGIVLETDLGLFYYSNETETATVISMWEAGSIDERGTIAMLCRPNFLSLRSFPMENTISF